MSELNRDHFIRYAFDCDNVAHKNIALRRAADEIERLRTENATAERLTLHHIELRDAQRRRAERAEAQVAALREALALFACDCAPKIECADPSYCRNSIARAALEEK